MTLNEMKLGHPSPSVLFPPTIEGFLAVDGGLTISRNSLKTWWPGTELNDSALNGFSNLLIAQWTQRTRMTGKTSVVCVLCAVFPSNISVSEHYIPLTQASRELRLIAVDHFENLLKGLKEHVQGTLGRIGHAEEFAILK
jgi:hypothetical protein